MSRCNFQVQYILRAYSRQLANRTRVSKGYRNKEEVILFTENKRRLLVDRIVKGIMDQFSGTGQLSETGRNILEQLSQECGKPLELSRNEGQGIAFKILNGKTGEGNYLSASENERLVKRLYDIAQSTPYNDFTEASTHNNIPDQE